MTRITTLIVLVIALTSVSLSGQTPQQLFRSAVNLETVDNDLRGAIEVYAKVAEGSDRALAAAALLRMAGCYEKLGEAEARAIYTRIVNSFADQRTQVIEAQARLAALAPAAPRTGVPPDEGLGVASRDVLLPRIEKEGGGGAGLSRLSPDGHRALFYSIGGMYSGLNVGIYDYDSKATTYVTTYRWDSPEQAGGAVWSPDGAHVAYVTTRTLAAGGVGEIFVATPGQTPRRLFATEEGRVVVTDWLRDDSALVVMLERPDESVSLGLVSLSDGSFSRLRTLQWSRATYARGSPDGRHIVFEDGSREARDLFLITTDGRSVVPLDEHPALDTQALWSPDGRHVVFRSTRQGRVAIWAVAVENGHAAGQPFMVMPEADDIALLDWTDRGIAYQQSRTVRDVYTAVIDPDSGETIEGPRMVPYPSPGWNHSPLWSPDGRMIAFISDSRGGARHQTVVVLPLDGSPPREASAPAELLDARSAIANMRWKPDGTELSMNSFDRQQRPLLLRLSLEDLRWTVQPLPEDLWANYLDWNPTWSEFFYYSRPDQTAFDEAGLFRADARTGARERLWQPPVHPIRSIRTSPDGRYIAFTILARIWIYDRESKAARQIPDIAAVPRLSWSPDSRFVLYEGADHPGTDNAEGAGFPPGIAEEARLRMLDVATGKSMLLTAGESLTDVSEYSLRSPVLARDGRSIAFGLQAFWGENRLLEDPLAGTGGGRPRR